MSYAAEHETTRRTIAAGRRGTTSPALRALFEQAADAYAAGDLAAATEALTAAQRTTRARTPHVMAGVALFRIAKGL